jgi:hypothetical protein
MCLFCNSDQANKNNEDGVEEILNRVEANDPASIFMMAHHYGPRTSRFATGSVQRQ